MFSDISIYMKVLHSLLISIVCLTAVPAVAVDSIELLYSDAFDGRGRDDQSLITFVHNNNWRYGTNFYFVDVSNLGNFENAGNTYIEWGPRLSPGKLLYDRTLSYGIIQDIYLIGELDYLKNKFVEKPVFLGGISFGLDLPGFRFFNLHLFNRNDPTLEGHTQQITFAWNLPFSMARQNFSVGGFIDASGSEGVNANTLIAQPQLLWELNERIFLGVEYLYWHNKGGRAGFNESAWQGVFRVNF